MLEKRVFSAVLSKINHGGLAVRYWDGEEVRFGPEAPYVTLIVNHPRAIRAIAKNLTIGFGESFMDGDIDIEGDLIQLPRLTAENTEAFRSPSWLKLPHRDQANRRAGQQRQIGHHYDIGNDFYKMWLDESMTYSCAYFRTMDDTLEQAQMQKVEHILRKLQLQPGQKLLDIGSGWGQLLIRAVQLYGVSGHGVTLSQEQFELSRKRVEQLGLSDKITVELLNYQDLADRGDQFDRIVSVGMYEHVGARNQASYFGAVRSMLAAGGLSVLHTITTTGPGGTDPWIDKYIFPGGFLPNVAKTIGYMEKSGFELLDYENLRFHYAMTLEEWYRRFMARWDEVVTMYDERFARMWQLYLAGSIAGFRYSELTLSQFVMTAGANSTLPLTREHLYPTDRR